MRTCVPNCARCFISSLYPTCEMGVTLFYKWDYWEEGGWSDLPSEIQLIHDIQICLQLIPEPVFLILQVLWFVPGLVLALVHLVWYWWCLSLFLGESRNPPCNFKQCQPVTFHQKQASSRKKCREEAYKIHAWPVSPLNLMVSLIWSIFWIFSYYLLHIYIQMFLYFLNTFVGYL